LREDGGKGRSGEIRERREEIWSNKKGSGRIRAGLKRPVWKGYIG
jgi:hypothetical protein